MSVFTSHSTTACIKVNLPSELSGGQKRRTALARLIIYRPKVLLYDEPTTGLDPVTAMHINELIEQTAHELGATSLIVTHDMQSALMLGDFFALHHEGTIAEVNNKEHFLQSENPLIREFLNNAFKSSRKQPLFSDTIPTNVIK
jgi:phospholipid/cholesterol/gamma-HCH transport system ATP-binding protein